MTKAVGFVSALIFALGTVPAARAQVMLDVSKITCEQFAGYKITTPQNIAIWLNGYYSGKRSNTVIDMQKLWRKYEDARKILHSKSSDPGHECSRNDLWGKIGAPTAAAFCAAGDVRKRL